jgi:transcriptional regulator with XRE-family HTH domain
MSDKLQISLRAARVNANLRLIDAAKLIGIGKDTLMKWEKSPGLVTPIKQEIISRIYGLPVDVISFRP